MPLLAAGTIFALSYVMRLAVCVLLLVGVLVLAAFASSPATEAFFTPLYLSGPTKCFSCEREMRQRCGPGSEYLGQNTKCFDCERQAAVPALTHPTKCFDCQAQHTTSPGAAILPPLAQSLTYGTDTVDGTVRWC